MGKGPNDAAARAVGEGYCVLLTTQTQSSQPQLDTCLEAPTPLPRISVPFSLQLEMPRGLKYHRSLKALRREFEICSAWPFATPSLFLSELLTDPRPLLFSTLQNSDYWKGRGGLRARVQQCFLSRASPRRPGSGAVRTGGAVPLRFYFDENILTNVQETNSSAPWEGEGELKGQACLWAPPRSVVEVFHW